MINNPRRNEMFDFVIGLFLSDTITMLDLVLSDDDSDPEYSAVMVYNRLFAYMSLTEDLSNLRNPSADSRIKELLIESGYKTRDIQRFMRRKKTEEAYYHGTTFS